MGRAPRDGYPVRYSLNPADRRKVSEDLKRSGGASTDEIRAIAAHYGVAAKTIHEVLSQLKLPVKTTAITAWDRAEELFQPKPPDLKTVKPEDPVLSERDITSELAALTSMEEDLRRERDDALKALETIEAELQDERKEAERMRLQAREAIAQTARLRRSTREDREKVDSVNGALASVRAKCLRLEKENRSLLEKLAASKGLANDFARQVIALLGALEKSDRLNAYLRSLLPD